MVNNRQFFLLLMCLSGIVFGQIASCTLQKEPAIPEGVGNATPPEFASSQVYWRSFNVLAIKAIIKSEGALHILKKGWVADTEPEPDTTDILLPNYGNHPDTMELTMGGIPSANQFYYRPYILTPDTLVFGEEVCLYFANQFFFNTDEKVFEGADILFQHGMSGVTQVLWSFDDGSFSTASAPRHTFVNPGIYEVTASIWQANCLTIQKRTVQVISDPFKNYWVSIPEGSFQMGCTPEQAEFCFFDTEPVHEVSLSAFTLGATEVTQFQWQAVMGGPVNCSECPVTNVSWHQIVQDFFPALEKKTGRQYRLPTEAEWEYSARANQVFTYAGSNDLNWVSWNFDNGNLTTHPVGTKSPNGFGLFDMNGNVWEWCIDYYGPYPSSLQTNPTGPASGSSRILRGGSAFTGGWCIATRAAKPPSNQPSDVGFRMVRIN